MTKDKVRNYNFPFKAKKRRGRHDWVVDTKDKSKGKDIFGRKSKWEKWATYDTRDWADKVAVQWRKSGSRARVRKVLAR